MSLTGKWKMPIYYMMIKCSFIMRLFHLIILEFGRAYKALSEIAKKNLANQFIERIEIFHEERDNGSVIKSVIFRFPIKLGGETFKKMEDNGLTSGNLVEGVILISEPEK